MSAFEFDHVMVCISEPKDALRCLCDFGLSLGYQGPQHGTGASHAVFFFDNAYLELVWPDVNGSAYVDAPRLHFRDRIHKPDSVWSPFGISFRTPDGPAGPIPVSTWSYAAPFLPAGAVPIPIGINSSNPPEPIIIVSLVSARPDERVPRPTLQSQRGLREITSLLLRSPGAAKSSPDLCRVRDFGWLTLQDADEHHLELEFDGGASSSHHDFAPTLPVSFRW